VLNVARGLALVLLLIVKVLAAVSHLLAMSLPTNLHMDRHDVTNQEP